ncbi:spore germination protein KA [Cohnella xylanilytica]|uniref:Spore germination protein n=1 Tax=Cohnella xylanilytica TaxID=557555 RepID=A0A841U3G1_9BACL|nr:spore germination protein [Cohnella xylanilytica]MBB6693678.1 spore germination protein [Cohnella xylanilytica]GIO15217.1 spore germination protein KA [Cohnella xylanilytica]
MFRRKRSRNQKTTEIAASDSGSSSLPPDLEDKLQRTKQEIGFSNDLVVRELVFGSARERAAAVYIDNMVDKKMVGEFVLRSIMGGSEGEEPDPLSMDSLKNRLLPVGEASVVSEWNEVLAAILNGDTALFVNGRAEAIIASTRGGEYRSVEEPSSEVLIRGPKEGFTESIATNISLVRRRLKTPNLWMDAVKIGKVSQTSVAILYLKGIASDKIVEEIKRRLKRIETDGILESGNIEEFIRDHPFSLFPTLLNTERPDSVAANLLEGRIAILIDGTPFVLVAPTTFFMFFQSAEDYYQNFQFAIFIRALRYVAFVISLLGPSIYVAAISFHQEMIPTSLLISLAAQREGVPFPALIEAFLMEASFEILREAGVRMPRAIGQAVSIVGAIVLGQAAVQAGIVSSAMVIVVSLTGIASFTTPAFNMGLSIRLLRFIVMISAGLFGFFGIALSGIIITAHLCSLRSLGVPYMAPYAPFIPADQKDAIFRLPLWAHRTRPRLVSPTNRTRMANNEPSPPADPARKDEPDES